MRSRRGRTEQSPTAAEVRTEGKRGVPGRGVGMKKWRGRTAGTLTAAMESPRLLEEPGCGGDKERACGAHPHGSRWRLESAKTPEGEECRDDEGKEGGVANRPPFSLKEEITGAVCRPSPPPCAGARSELRRGRGVEELCAVPWQHLRRRLRA